jgi:hypothetical protein
MKNISIKKKIIRKNLIKNIKILKILKKKNKLN